MKRTVVIAAICSLVLACEMPQQQAARELTQQEAFYEYMKIWEDNYYRKNSNDLQRKEFIAAYKDSLAAYIDSISPLIGWTGIVKDIKVKELPNRSQRGFSQLTFEIECEIQEYQKLTLECEYLFKTANMKSDYLYQKVFNLRDYGMVKFDGMVGTRKDGSIDWYSEDIFNQYLSYPRIRLWVTDIASREAKDTLSPALISAYKLYVDKYNLSRQRANGKITKKEATSMQEPLDSEIGRYRKDSLSANENAYLDFVEHQCAASFLRAIQ